ncbi:hypothetical protein KY290_035871 [Solanum tuberosum]|uniref:Uncharacterized protein n=1 Tax=Solanum tuberosum TaxID=4113 RepID=A0ABQ7TRM8_SOLTU|nr:hypothetical protein KY290_035871 [Solanum tuberosum]
MFVGEGYTQYCETFGALGYGLNHRVYWKRSKNDMAYSTSIVDNTSSCDCNSSEMGNACLVIQDVNVVILHNLAVLEANWLYCLVDQMHRGIVLAIGVSGQDFIWDANMDRDNNDNNMIFVLLHLNLEGKVLFEEQSNVTNLATMQDPIDILSNYIWNPV